MNTKQIAEYRGISEKLVRAVIRQTGEENLLDIANHGANAGFAGFTYYNETVAFFKRHRAEIVELVNRMAEDLGEVPVEMVAGFNCLGGQELRGNRYPEDKPWIRSKALAEWLPSVSRCLYGGRLTEDDTDVANALAWFAAEEVARAWQDYQQDKQEAR